MTDLIDDAVSADSWRFDRAAGYVPAQKGKLIYFVSKRAFDLIASCAAIPVFLVLCGVIYVLNFFGNPGPLFYCQPRMGKDQSKFSMIKFRTMLPETSKGKRKRGPFDALENWRITPLGRWMRRTRLDEIPQILNVISGQMSLIGPRPEMYEFAQTYSKEMPGYHIRGTVRPGITGFSQVKQGYTDSEEMVRLKTHLDTYYVQNMSWYMDLKVLFWTVCVVFTFNGAK